MTHKQEEKNRHSNPHCHGGNLKPTSSDQHLPLEFALSKQTKTTSLPLSLPMDFRTFTLPLYKCVNAQPDENSCKVESSLMSVIVSELIKVSFILVFRAPTRTTQLPSLFKLTQKCIGKSELMIINLIMK